MSEFKKYAMKHLRMNSSSLDVHQRKHIHHAPKSMTPYIVEEREMNIAQMDVFSRLMMDRIIFLGMPIDDDVANVVQAQLLFLESLEPNKDIRIYLNTPGGGVHAGLGIYDTMQYIKPNVDTICTGMAASMGAVLLSAGHKRSALKHSRVMIHQPSGGTYGPTSDMEIDLKEIIKLKHELNTILSTHSGQSIERISTDTDRDYWMTSAEAKEYGLIDVVL